MWPLAGHDPLIQLVPVEEEKEEEKEEEEEERC